MDFISRPGERDYGHLRRGRGRSHRHQSPEMAGTPAGLRRHQTGGGCDQRANLRPPRQELREMVDARRHRLHRSRAEDQRRQVRQEGVAREVQGLSTGDGLNMLADNIKLLFKLYYRPASAMSDIIDRGNWLFGAALVTATAVLLGFTVTNRIYRTYESASIPPEERRAARKSQPEISPSDQPQADPDGDVEEDLEQNLPDAKRLPLPVIGEAGWRLVSFNPTSLFAIALSLAALYAPAAILALTLITRTGSFGVAFRRDYGSLLICAYMAWAASHLPFALAGFALNPLKLGAEGALALWLLGNGCFGALMIFAIRTVCG